MTEGRLTIRQAVVVEGKYDKIKLQNLIDAVIIEVNGFGIFRDVEKIELIRSLARQTGIIILTDSDSAGFLIRGRLAGLISEGTVLHGYIPDIYGKEKRKTAPSGEGKLGVEGIDGQIIIKALLKAGASEGSGSRERREEISAADFYETGITGRENSSKRRREFVRYLELPERISQNALLRVLNTRYSKDEFLEIYRQFSGEGEREGERGREGEKR